jgi:Mn2+/Fe2+ NRAMP family transporter
VGSSRAGFLAALGPGLLFAAAAVGVSHLVQSTRAGAGWGLALVGVVILANFVKYAPFRFGPEYATATGTSLLEGYRRIGRWALVLYGLLTLGTMFTVQAAVTVVTAGLAIATLKLTVSPVLVSAVLIAVCAAVLAVGRFQLLDRVTKVLVAALTISTLIATAAALPRVDFGTLVAPPAMDAATVMFIAALFGWMPSAIDVAVWQSLWTLARARATGHRPTRRESLFDFHLGYIGTAVLALCFVIMGAGVMHGRGVPLSDAPAGFAAQVIALYTETLGAWIGPVVGTAAFAVMFSTTLTVLDGFPRALSALTARFAGPESELEPTGQGRAYWIAMALLGGGAVLLLALFLTSLKGLVDVATTLSFLTAPILSAMNHRAIFAAEVPLEARPRPWLRLLSLASIAFSGLFAAYYLFLRYG